MLNLPSPRFEIALLAGGPANPADDCPCNTKLFLFEIAWQTFFKHDGTFGELSGPDQGATRIVAASSDAVLIGQAHLLLQISTGVSNRLIKEALRQGVEREIFKTMRCSTRVPKVLKNFQAFRIVCAAMLLGSHGSRIVSSIVEEKCDHPPVAQRRQAALEIFLAFLLVSPKKQSSQHPMDESSFAPAILTGQTLKAQISSYLGGCVGPFNGDEFGFATGPGDLPDQVGECSTTQFSAHAP